MIKNLQLNKGEMILVMDEEQKKSFINKTNIKIKQIVENNPLLATILIPIMTSMVASFFVWVISGLWHLPESIREINDKYTKLDERMVYVENQISINNGDENNNVSGDNNITINGNKNNNVSGNDNVINSSEGSSTIINGGQTIINGGNTTIYYFMSNTTSPVLENPKGIQNAPYAFPVIRFSENQTVAIDASTGEGVTISEISNQKAFYIYQDDNQEILFYGQLTEEGQWDGECLINVYENDILMNITDSVYEEGTLKSYKQVSSFVNNRGITVWSVAYRTIVGEGISSGESYTYYKVEDCSKRFNKATEENLILVEDFQEKYCTIPEGYYYGQTSGGNYNDTTGESYNIKYFENGKIRTLYVGNFVDGEYCDSTGNAWYITKEKNTEYMYYTGEFAHNTATEKATKDNSKTELTYDQINEILVLSGRTFKNLYWQFEEFK